MRKIFFVSNTAWSLFNFRISLMRYLKSQGHDVRAIAPYDGFADRLKKEFPFIGLGKLDRKGKSFLKDFNFFEELYRIYKEHKPDLVLHFTIKPNIYGSIACGLLRIPSVANVTGLGYVFTGKSFLSLIVKKLYKFSFSFSEKVVFQNPVDYDFFISGKIIPLGKGAIIPGSGVNTEKFSPEFCKNLGKNKDSKNKIVFLMVSRMLWDKGVKEFVKVAKIIREKYQNVEFWLLGPVDEGNPAAVPRHVLDLWEKEGVIKYPGVTDDVRSFICQSDVVVLPSFYREGIPRVLLEAMAMAKPIITTDAPGCRETVVDGVNGFMVKPKDVESLAGAMEKMLVLPKDERDRMGREGRKMVFEKFDEKIVIEKYMEIIGEVMGDEWTRNG